jgi:lysine decarboxylase/arginine decarboxylase
MVPTRNGFGIMGPIPKTSMMPASIRKAITDSPLIVGENRSSNPNIAVVTNSTYDGICYDAAQVESILGQSTDCIHFDEAWYGYARFNPIYDGRYAMRDDDATHGPTVFATQSTHKLLAALSQASMIHMKEGKHHVDPDIFNETFMMHASTSPQYAIIASLDVSSKMMDSNGYQLTQDAIEEAIRFRQMMARIKSQTNKGDWWFNVWQPEHIHIPGKLTKSRFEDIDINILSKDKDCWVLRKDDKWHGFTDIDDGWAMLDPIKVTVLTPGLDASGNYSEFGIPAAILVAYLDEKGIVNEKSGDYNILFLFSMGVTNGKWGSLVSEFYDFKRLFDENAPMEDVLPKIYNAHPERYKGVTIQNLAREMHLYIMDNKQTILGNKAASSLPRQVMTPADAYVQMVRGNVEQVKVDEAMGRVAASGIVPYPPGVPILMPGERIGDSTDPMLRYMHTLQEFDRKFPGFEHDSHGIEVIDHDYYMYCVKE